MQNILAVLALLAVLAFIGGIAMLFFKAKRKRGFKVAGISLVAMIGFGTIGSTVSDQSAKQAGFLDAGDRAMAERAGVTSAEAWASQRDEYLAQYAASLAAEKAAQDQREQEERAAQAQAEATQRAVEKAERDRVAEERAAMEVAAVEGQQAAEVEAKAARGQERAAQQQVEAQRIAALNGFPDEDTKNNAKAMGLSRFEAFKLLDNATAISHFCKYDAALFELSNQKWAEIDNGQPVSETTAKYDLKMEALLGETNAALGLVDFELITLSQAGHWIAHCKARKQGWSVITNAKAQAVSKSDAKDAEKALRAVYADQLRNGSVSRYFNRDRYSGAECKREQVDGLRFVQCTLMGWSATSQPHLYLVGGKQENGAIVVEPVNGPTIQTFKEIAPTALRRSPVKVIPAIYAGKPIAIAEVLKAFE